MVEPLPGYVGPVFRGAIGGTILGAFLGLVLGYLSSQAGFDVPLSTLPLWTAVAAVMGAIQGSSHLALLRHRLRQELIYGVDSDHDH